VETLLVAVMVMMMGWGHVLMMMGWGHVLLDADDADERESCTQFLLLILMMALKY
jgi:hypothetical protein